LRHGYNLALTWGYSGTRASCLVFLGPIFSVELITSGRRLRFVLIRALYAALLLFILWASYASYGPTWGISADLGTTANFAARFFGVFSWTQLLAVLFVAPAVTAGAIAQERERRTLEYLFASDLRDHEIVLGKYAVRVLNTACFAIAGLPVLQIASLMGGIDPETLLLVFAITVSTMLTVSALAMAMSVWARRAREAIIGTYLVLFCGLILPFPVLAWVGTILGRPPWIDLFGEFVMHANPLYALGLISSDALAFVGRSPWSVVGWLLLTQGTITAACLGVSVWGVRRVQRKQASAGTKRSRWRLPRPAPGKYAMLWKEMFAERSSSRLGLFAGIARALLVLFVAGVAIWQFVDSLVSPQIFGGSDYAATQYASMVLTLSIVTVLLGLLIYTARAATLVSGEKERDCWISLIATDLSASEIVTAKIVGNLYAARGLWMLVAFLWALGVARHPPFALAMPFLIGTTLAVAWFASSLGVWFSLWCRTSMRAMGASVALATFVGGGYLFCCWPVFFVGAMGNTEMMLLVFTPAVPFLLAVPGMFALADLPSGSPETTMALAAYVFGTLGYAVAGLLLWSASIGSFDRLAGRISRRTQPRARGGQAVVAVEVIEEQVLESGRSPSGGNPFGPP